MVAGSSTLTTDTLADTVTATSAGTSVWQERQQGAHAVLVSGPRAGR